MKQWHWTVPGGHVRLPRSEWESRHGAIEGSHLILSHSCTRLQQGTVLGGQRSPLGKMTLTDLVLIRTGGAPKHDPSCWGAGGGIDGRGRQVKRCDVLLITQLLGVADNKRGEAMTWNERWAE